MEQPIDRRRVTRAFKLRGLTLQASALEALMEVIVREDTYSDQFEALQAILEASKERCGSERIVSTDILSQVVSELSRNAKDVNDEAVQLLNAFEMPRLSYDTMRKHFQLELDEKRSLFGEATHKVSLCYFYYCKLCHRLKPIIFQVDMFAQRFALIQQRILKQDVFRPKLVSADGRQASSDPRHVTHSLTTIESLLGRPGVRFLLGMLVQVEEGRYYLEDHTAQVPLDVSQAQILTDGVFTEQSIVLVEGEMVEDVLYVHRLGHPIIETRQEAMQTIGLSATDIFQSVSTLADLEDIQEQEKIHGPDGLLVIIANVHLDRPHVLDRLKTLLEGFSDANPVYVFMGNFLSGNRSSPKELMGYFDDLANLICSIPGLAQKGRFIFMPGPNDPGVSDCLPRPPLPKYCTNSLSQRLVRATFATNPCRIRYFTKEMVVFRNNVTSHLTRSALLPTRDGSTPYQHAYKTLLDQGHLCPYPRQPIYWQFDHALRLYPLPDAVLCGDATVSQFYENYAECDIVNPGSFGSNGDFVVYRPIASVEEEGLTKSDVEFSQITD
jgi:DNA polymerase epsilon subunit 2